MNRWISVENKLPERDGFILVYHNHSDGIDIRIGINRYCKKNGWQLHKTYAYLAGITHWMPLPNKPEEK